MTRFDALAAIAGLLALAGTIPASAQDIDPATVRIADASRGTGSVSASPVAVSADAEQDAYACNKARRRLWVEGEGWVVRRITTCR